MLAPRLLSRYGESLGRPVRAILAGAEQRFGERIADTSLSAARVAQELTALIRIYGQPGCIVSDNVLAREQTAVFGRQITGHPSDRIPLE